jgi:hypothetical protein
VTPSVGTIEVTVANNAGDTAVTTVRVLEDGEAPQGGSISYPSFAAAGETVEIATDPGSDDGSGVDVSSLVVERRLAVRSDAGCESFGNWTPAGVEATAREGTCVEYRLRVQDNVANEAVVRSHNVLEVPDETAPLTAVTAPAPGIELIGEVTVSAMAEDAGSGIRSVTFQAAPAWRSSWVDLGTVDAAPYALTWDTGRFKPGAYSVRAVAVDRAGNAATSEAVSVVVAEDVTAPTTWIVEPAAGAAVSGLVAVSAHAEDHESGVDSVTVQVRSPRGCWVNLGTFEGADGSVSWDTTRLDPGRYLLRSVAKDRRGNVGRSSHVEVVLEEPEDSEEPEPKPDPPDDSDEDEGEDEEAEEQEEEEEAAEPSEQGEEKSTGDEPHANPEAEAETSTDEAAEGPGDDTVGEEAPEDERMAADGAGSPASP